MYKTYCAVFFTVITYHICEFYRNILPKNKIMAVRIQKCMFFIVLTTTQVGLQVIE